MTRTTSLFSFALAAAVLAAHAAPAVPPLFDQKAKTDTARVRALLEVLKSDPDDKKRLSATAELAFADAREQPDLIPALAAALKRDTSAKVRAGAADALGQLNVVSPLAGAALEAAAVGDAVPDVRAACKQALWGYHLNGYRSAQGLGWRANETEEPPIAARPGPRVVVALTPVGPPPAAPKASAPQPPVAVPVPQLPPVAQPAGPRVVRSFFADMVASLKPAPKPSAGPPPLANVTPEPPLAQPAFAVTVPPVPVQTEPPALIPDPPGAAREPDYVPTLPPFLPELPPVVQPPGATPEPAPRAVPRIPATLPK